MGKRIYGVKEARRERLTGKCLSISFQDVNGDPYSYNVIIEKCLGEGTSCICYEVTVQRGKDGIGQKRVLKQFYPDPEQYLIDTSMDGIQLNIAGYSEENPLSTMKDVVALGKAFEESCLRQNDLSNQKVLDGIIVKPDVWHFDGSTKYILYEDDYGSMLDFRNITSISEFLDQMYQLAVCLQKLHEHNLLYVDLRPENILVSENKNIKLLDFDSVIDLSRLDEVHLSNGKLRYDPSNIDLIAPEIRKERLLEFEQDKRFLLTKAVDVYSFGAIMFSFFTGRYPNKKDIKQCRFQEEFKEIFNTRYRGELTAAEQDQLIEMLGKCIKYDRSPRAGRYQDLTEAIKILKQIRDLSETEASKRRVKYGKANSRIQSAFVLDENPICDYLYITPEDQQIMDCLIVGEEPIAEDFLINIISSVQMLDTKHIIRVALPMLHPEANWSKAKLRLEEYLRKWPLLSKTMKIYRNDEEIIKSGVEQEIQIDHEIVEEPLAEIRFYDWPVNMDIKTFYTRMQAVDSLSWIILADRSLQKAWNTTALEMAEQFATLLEARGEESFIGYLDERGDGYDFQKTEKDFSGVQLYPFSDNEKPMLEEDEFETGIRKRAKLLHRHYMVEWQEVASKHEVWEDFSSDMYNVTSSICSVLSIPYKLASVGIHTKGEDAAREYNEIVLANHEQNKEFNDLMYLEHLRWIGFMLTEGYDRPTKQQVETYAYRDGRDHRDKKRKLHPCICASKRENGISLDNIPAKVWDQEQAQEIQTLDLLDQMSMEQHQLCNRRIRELEQNETFQDAMYRLENALEYQSAKHQVFEAFEYLQMIYYRTIGNESNSNHLWRRACKKFEELLDKDSEVYEIFKNIKTMMKVVEARNQYHDYKSSDRTILEVIPLLLNSNQMIRRIHKPVSEKTWENIVSSIIIEPESLYLYTDESESVDLQVIREFLEKNRKLDITIKVKKWEELKKCTYKNAVNGALDLTGLSAEDMVQLFEISSLHEETIFDAIPTFLFKNGKIKSIGRPSSIDDYRGIRRHISVEDNFKMFHAMIHSMEEDENYVLGLSDTYQEMWDSYNAVTSEQYRQAVECLKNIELENYHALKKENPQEVEFTKSYISYGMLKDSGLDNVLQDLCKDGWIREYSIPKIGSLGTVSVITKYSSVKKVLTDLFNQVQANPYLHRYTYVKTKREAVEGRKSQEWLYYIRDNTLFVNVEIDNPVLETKDGKEQTRYDFVKPVIDQLKSRELIVPVNEKNGALIKETKDTILLQFMYTSSSIKQCLMDEKNILEACVYHIIWNHMILDDVMLNVTFTWDAEDASDAWKKYAITNEIDLVCTKEMQTYFISCKQKEPEAEELQEIKYFADYFGVDGKAILITTNQSTSKRNKSTRALLDTKRAGKMKVYYIDREMLEVNGKIDLERLAKYLQNIFNGKKDWKAI